MIIGALIVTMAWLCCGVALLNIALWPRVRRAPHSEAGQVSVLIPARNEETNLPACLEAVRQQGVIVGEILVYDDHSTDSTARVAGEYAARDARLRLIAPSPLPAGWCGKNFACAQLARAAQGEWLLFIDADARLRAGAVAAMVGEMRRRDLQMLSCWPGLEMVSFWERALMPLLNFVVFTLFPAPLSLLSQRPSLGLAHGACLMFERARYEALGGHALVRDQIFEDTRLAQLWRARGARGLCLDGQEVLRVRMYTSFAEIWRGFQKNFFPAFKRELSFWAFIALHATVFFAPFVLLLLAPSWPLATAALAVVLGRLMLAARFGHPLWSALLHPVAEAVLIALGLSSWWRCKSGRGVVWKERAYHTSK